MGKIKYSIWAFFIHLFGCAQGYTHFAVSPQATPEEYAMVERAIQRWNLCGLVHADVHPGNPRTPDELLIEPSQDIPEGKGGQTHWGWNLHGPSPDWIRYRPTTPFKEAAITHELGHGLGIYEHTHQGLMTGHPQEDPTVTQSDCDALAQALH